MTKSSKSRIDASTTASATVAPRPKRKARLPPVIDRPGVAASLSSSPAESPDPTLTPTTTGATVPPVVIPAVAAGPAIGVTPIDPATVPIMDPAPTMTFPAITAGFVPVPSAELAGYRPLQTELAVTSDAIYELTQFVNWALLFGVAAPGLTASSVAQRIQVAAGWTALLAASTGWVSYVKSQEGTAWKYALEVTGSLKPSFQIAVTANPALATQYPALSRFLGAQKAVAKKASVTKKKNAAAKATAAVSATTAAATTVVAAPVPTARVVTVQG